MDLPPRASPRPVSARGASAGAGRDPRQPRPPLVLGVVRAHRVPGHLYARQEAAEVRLLAAERLDQLAVLVQEAFRGALVRRPPFGPPFGVAFKRVGGVYLLELAVAVAKGPVR